MWSGFQMEHNILFGYKNCFYFSFFQLALNLKFIPYFQYDIFGRDEFHITSFFSPYFLLWFSIPIRFFMGNSCWNYWVENTIYICILFKIFVSTVLLLLLFFWRAFFSVTLSNLRVYLEWFVVNGVIGFIILVFN